MNVAIVPYDKRPGFGFQHTPLASLRWPLGAPADLSGTVGDLGAEDHLIFYPSSRLYYAPFHGVRCKFSLMIVEPEAVHGRHMRLMRLFHRRFYKVLTCNRALKAAIPNALHYVFGSSWIKGQEALDRAKTRQLSLIASAKRVYEGHQLRHATADWLMSSGFDADLLGRGYRPFDEKTDGLAPYRYSVVIENVREPGYFTEKLIDCLICDTVPIYWGAPDIGDYFDGEGMLICNSLDDIKAATDGLSKADYERRLTAIGKNRKRALQYADHERNAAWLLTSGTMPAKDI